MNPQELIRKKRDGASLTLEDINVFIDGVCDGSWADYQIAALVMAMFIRGLNTAEQNALVGAMLESGDVLDFSEIDGPVADKHSTGGVGDKTSLIIAPLAAACGLIVPMISGRGLGHTGGTLDKLESIDGYRVNLTREEIRQVIENCGFALAGQTERIVPADRKLYALRDAAAMIESVPLIVASIMSKKLAEGLDALVLDVKTGTGAFMEKREDAQRLAAALVKTGRDFGVSTEAVISDMNQPLGKFIGNSLEVYECIKLMRGEVEDGMQPTLDLSIDLTARLLVLARVAEDFDQALGMCREKIRDGSALELFRKNLRLQNGDPRICDRPEMLVAGDIVQVPVKASRSGFVSGIDAKTAGAAVCSIGGGRVKVEDVIDPAVGFACLKKIGDEVRESELLGILYCRGEGQAQQAGEQLSRAFAISEDRSAQPELIKEVIEGSISLK